MKSYKSLLAALAFTSVITTTTGCREDFSEINKTPQQL